MKLYKFYASWCGPCKQQTKEFEENPVDIELEAINIDEDDKGLTTKYGIRSIPTTILIDENSSVIQKWVGFTKSSTINDFTNGLRSTGAPEGE